VGRTADVVGIPPVRVLSTREGLGLYSASFDPFAVDGVTPPPVPVPTAPCRLHPGGWHGDLGGVLTKVTGQGGVPEVGVAAVAVDVTALGSTAPASVTVWAPGQLEGQVVATMRMNGRGHGSAVVPVASDGTIAFATSAGGTDLAVDVTGYYPVGDQPNSTAVAPLQVRR
jgi:hypothetical protein